MRYFLLLLSFTSGVFAQSAAISAALATGSYFPLDVGDRWVYRIDDRFVTGSYQTWRIDRLAPNAGATYSVMALEGPGALYAEYWFRADSTGKVYILTGNGDQLFLDPNSLNTTGAELTVTSKTSQYKSTLGTFADALNYSNLMGGLILETGTLVRGVGLLTSTADLMTGSSGGFTQGRTLVEATVAGGIHFPAASSSIQLGMESLNLDVTGKHVTNCAIPCYYAACGLGSPVDPPGTYKPCAQARVGLLNWPAGQTRDVRMQLLAADGSILFDQTFTVGASAGEAVRFVQVPLYTAPNVSVPLGSYRLTAKTADGAAQSTVSITIQ